MIMTTDVYIKKLRDDAILPEQGSAAAAGYDVFAALDMPVEIAPHETKKVGTGLAMAVNDSYWIGIFARSGLATKEGLRPANCVGVVDSDYRGEIIVAVHNDSDTVRTVVPGEKIGQLIILPTFRWNMIPVKELDETARGAGGFGSTGQ